MRISRYYRVDSFNHHLLPRLMNELAPFTEVPVGTTERFIRYETEDEKGGTANPSEFEAILTSIGKPILSLMAVAEVHDRPGSGFGREPGFALLFRPGHLQVHLGRADVTTGRKRLESFERLAGLKPGQRAIPNLAKTVFVAHAFDAAGNRYALEVVRFLGLLGFAVSTGDAFSPESVSAKVKRRLAAQAIVIAIVSQKKDLTWLIQEAAGASFLQKPLFLLVEEGVELSPGVNADLEYIKFPAGSVSEAFLRIMEGLVDLGFGVTLSQGPGRSGSDFVDAHFSWSFFE